MGQKVNPVIFRIGVNETWASNWFADKDYRNNLYNDYIIRKMIHKEYKDSGIAKTVISRKDDKTTIQVYCVRTGMIIGKKGTSLDKLKKVLSPYIKGELVIDIVEVKKPDLSAPVIAQSIANQLEKRVSFRRAMRRAIVNALKNGAKGIKICSSGRLGGAEIARSEWYREGRLKLQTIRSSIDYALAEAYTTYGVIGVKVWVCTGERYTYKNII